MQGFVQFICRVHFNTLILAFLVVFCQLCCASTSTKNFPEDFVKQLYKEVIVINRSRIAQAEQLEKIKRLMIDNIEFDMVSRFVLGKNFTIFSAEEFENFKQLYKKSIARKYAKFLMGHQQELNIIKAEDIGKKRYLVDAKVRFGDAKNDIKMSYLIIKNKEGNYKIIDIIVADGISLASEDRKDIGIFLESKKPKDLLAKLAETKGNLSAMSGTNSL